MQPIKVESRNSGPGQTSLHSGDWRVLGYAPVPNSIGRRRRNAINRPSRYSVADIIGICFLVLLTCGASLFVYAPRAVSPLIVEAREGLRRASGWAGLNVGQISVSGHRYSSDIDIFEVLNKYSGQSLIGMDVKAASIALKKLSWIKDANIARAFPDELVVVVDEREPFAMWQVGKSFWIIDARGEKLAQVASDSFPDLIGISGVGAHKNIAGFVEILRTFPKLWREISTVKFIGERRWSLILESGLVAHLPVRNVKKALMTLEQVQNNDEFDGADFKIVDFRLDDRIVLRRGQRKPVVSQVNSQTGPQSDLSSVRGTLTERDLSIPSLVHKSMMPNKNGGAHVKY